MQELDRAISRRDWLRMSGAACLTGGATLLPRAAAAQQWPTQPVKIVIAVGAGSSGDTLARLLAPRLETMWKQPVIVENKPGGGGIVGTDYVVRATDGHTLLLGSQSSILPKFTRKNLSYDPQADLVPVYRLIDYQIVIAANTATVDKAKTLQGLVEMSKTGDGEFFAGMGATSIFNVTMAIINKSLGMKYSAVPFNSIGNMNMAVLRNDAQFLVNTPSSIQPQVDAGELKPIAAVSAQRYPNLPDVPTLQEAVGYKGYLPLVWAGMFVPKAMPAGAVDRIAGDLKSLIAEDEFRRSVETRLTGIMVRASSPAAFAQEIAEEIKVWGELFTALNIKPE